MTAPLPIDVGLCSVTVRDLVPAAVVELAVAAGVDAIEWGGDVHVPPGDLDAATVAARACADAGVACPSYGSYLLAGGVDLGGLSAVLDTTEALGAALVRIWCPLGVGPEVDDAARSPITDAVAAVATAAAGRGLQVGLELHDWTLTERAASTRRLLDEVGAPNLSTYWQPLVPTLDRAAEELEAVLDRCSHLHVQQLGTDGERRPLADGAVDWRALLTVAAGTPPAGVARRVAHLEFVRGDDPAQLVADAATLRAWLRPDGG